MTAFETAQCIHLFYMLTRSQGGDGSAELESEG